MTSELTIILKALDKASRPVGNVTRSVKDLGTSSSNALQRGLSPLSASLGVGIRAAAGIGGIAIGGLASVIGKATSDAMNMEQQVADIASVMGKTADEVGPLKTLIQDLGVDPKLKVSATEAADAIQMLARNGLTMDEILAGAARSTVLLSNATNADFGTAADTATDAMALFNIEAKDMDGAVNGIASVLTSSKFDINDYRLALANAGGMAKTVGVSFDDFNTSISAMSSFFASGSDAGTAFKTFLQRLDPATDPAKDAMQELGLWTAESGSAFFDASGEIKSMAEISGLLNEATKDLSAEQKAAALNTIFGTDALRAAAAMSEITEEEFGKLQDRMAQTDAAEMAATRVDTFKGALEILQSVIGGVMLQIGDSFVPLIKSLTERFTELVTNNKEKITNFFSLIAEKIKLVIDNAELIMDAIRELGSHFVTFNFDLYDTTEAIQEVLTKFGVTSDKANLIGNKIFELSVKWENFIQKLRDFIDPIVKVIAENVKLQDVLTAAGILVTLTVIPALVSLVAAIAPIAVAVGGAVAAVTLARKAWENDWWGIQGRTEQAKESIGTALNALSNRFSPFRETVKNNMSGALQEIGTFVTGGETKFTHFGNIARSFSTTFTGIFNDLGNKIPQIIGKLTDSIVNGIDWLMGPGLEMLLTSLKDFPKAMSDMFSGEGEGSIAGDMIAAFAKAIGKIVLAVGEMGVKIAWAIISGFAEALIPGISNITEAIEEFVGKMWNKFKEFLGISSPSSIAHQMGIDLVQGLINGFNLLFNRFVNHVANSAQSIINQMKNYLSISGLFQAGKDVVQGLINGFNNLMDRFGPHVAAVAQNLINRIGNILHPGALWEIGKQLVQGLIDAFNQTMDNFVNNHVVAVAENVKSRFRSLFGIESPSKVFKEYGGDLMAGLRDGMIASMADVIGGVDNVVSGITGETQNSIVNNTTNNSRNYNISLPETSGGQGSRGIDIQAARIVGTLSAITG